MTCSKGNVVSLREIMYGIIVIMVFVCISKKSEHFMYFYFMYLKIHTHTVNKMVNSVFFQNFWSQNMK